MKTILQFPRRSCWVLSCLMLVTAGTTSLPAANNNSSSNKNAAQTNSANQSDNSTKSSGNESSTQEIKVTRATNFLGTDVLSSDGRKVGDIVDYYFDPSGSPHLKYVVIMTGGFLGFGGDARAVPAGAISLQSDTAKLKITRDAYWNVDVLPQNRDRYISQKKNADELAEAFGLAKKDSGQKSQSSNQPEGSRQLVSFSDLQNSDVLGSDGERLGRFVDTWINLDAGRAPYVEISSPPESPFQVTPRHRYAIPMNRLQNSSDDGTDVTFNVTADDVRDSKSISEMEGVKRLQSGEIGKAILRVRVTQQ